MVDGNGKDSDDVSRHEFLNHAGKIAVAAGTVGVIAGGVRMAMPNVDQGRPRRVSLGSPGDFKMGTVTWLAELELFVIREQGGFGAFSSRCTHLGCTVRRVSTGFHCPCHGAQYDSLGRVVAGPARTPLPWFEVRIAQDGKLWADREVQIESGAFVVLRTENGNGRPPSQ